MSCTPLAAEIPPGITDIAPEMVAIRHRIHADPELGFQEFHTSALVADLLAGWGFAVHRGLGGTGVVGTLRCGNGTRSLGIRADMDALPIHEQTGLPYASRNPGTMHACGHDGHTAMLLTAARHLARTRHFDGTLHLIFQPAEEGLGGARKMMEDGLFERFPCDAVFALHNVPGYPAGRFGFRSGAFMASSDTATITVHGKGGHGGMPAQAVDPVVVGASIVMALQTIVARNVDPTDSAVVTVGAFLAGNAPNVIPGTAELRLTIRSHSPRVRDLLQQRITDLAQAQAASYGARAQVDYQRRYPVLVNHEAETAHARRVALEWLGPEGLIQDLQPQSGAEDFAYILEQTPGCYLIMGNGDGEHAGAHGCMVHNAAYDFNDACLPMGATYWVKLTEDFLHV
jgi:hippurate hydrolase